MKTLRVALFLLLLSSTAQADCEDVSEPPGNAYMDLRQSLVDGDFFPGANVDPTKPMNPNNSACDEMIEHLLFRQSAVLELEWEVEQLSSALSEWTACVAAKTEQYRACVDEKRGSPVTCGRTDCPELFERWSCREASTNLLREQINSEYPPVGGIVSSLGTFGCFQGDQAAGTDRLQNWIEDHQDRSSLKD